MRRSYHSWLDYQRRSVERGDPAASSSTDDLLNKMVEYFSEPRDHLREVIGAWDGTPESVGE